MEWLIARLKEKTTWIGLTSLLGVAGVVVSPEQAEAIGLAAVAIVSAILTFTTEKQK